MSSPGGRSGLGRRSGSKRLFASASSSAASAGVLTPGVPQHDPHPETKKKVDAAKAYIENLYKNQADALRRRVERRAAVEHEARASSMPAETKEELLSELERREREFTRLKRAKMTAEDFGASPSSDAAHSARCAGAGQEQRLRVRHEEAQEDGDGSPRTGGPRQGGAQLARGGARRSRRQALLLVPGRGVPVPGDGYLPGGT